MENKLSLKKETIQRLGGSPFPAAREGEASRRTDNPGLNVESSVHITTTIFTIP